MYYSSRSYIESEVLVLRNGFHFNGEDILITYYKLNNLILIIISSKKNIKKLEEYSNKGDSLLRIIGLNNKKLMSYQRHKMFLTASKNQFKP